jgi:O-antigen ligase
VPELAASVVLATLPEAVPASRRGMLAFVGRVFLLATIPFSLIWVPLARIPGAGNIVVGDLAQIGLWALTLMALLVRGRGDLDLGLRTPLIAGLALVIAVLAGIGADLGRSRLPALEIMMFMKRFGLAAIIPVAAVLFGSTGMGRWTRALTAIMIGVLVAFTFDPTLQDWLPRPENWDADIFASEQRATGSVTNPNDLAYASVALLILHAAFLPRRAGIFDRLLLVAALAGSATCLISSGSRSGVMGAAGALLFVVLTSSLRIRSKAALLLGGWLAVVAGLSYSVVFDKRLMGAYREGLSEGNISSRLSGQWLALRATVENPFGVGYAGLARASARESSILQYGTSDSVYFDTLLGAGVLGLLCLLMLFWMGWRHIGVARPPDDPRAHLLKAGLVAFLLFGTATVVPISIFLSPLFFQTIGAAAYPDRDERLG